MAPICCKHFESCDLGLPDIVKIVRFCKFLASRNRDMPTFFCLYLSTILCVCFSLYISSQIILAFFFQVRKRNVWLYCFSISHFSTAMLISYLFQCIGTAFMYHRKIQVCSKSEKLQIFITHKNIFCLKCVL